MLQVCPDENLRCGESGEFSNPFVENLRTLNLGEILPKDQGVKMPPQQQKKKNIYIYIERERERDIYINTPPTVMSGLVKHLNIVLGGFFGSLVITHIMNLLNGSLVGV